MTSSRSQPCF